MIIKQIKLTNFRQFMGEHVIEFSTDKEKNVSVILGSNTCGKTTIVGAFIWGLYGVNNLKEPKMLLNSVLAQKLTFGSQDVSVEITLNHDNKDYIILRTQRFSKSATGDSVRGNTPELKVSYVVESGETIPVNPAECQNVIESILPQALSDYFFFDGERIKSINTKANVKDAVRGLMGLDVYSAGMDHLNPNSGSSVIGKFKKEIDTGKDQEATRRKYQIEEFKANLDGYEKKTPQILDELQHWQTKKDEYDRIIRENEDVKAAQTKRAQLEREVADYEEEIKNSETRFINDINYNASKFFAIPLIKRGFEVLKSAKDEGEGIPNMHASSIEYILKRGKCICGCDLTKNQGAVECIQHEQSLLPPQHIGTEVRMFRKDMENALSTSAMYVDNIKSDYRTWLNSQQKLEYCKKDLKIISDKIIGFEDVEKYERKRQEAVQQLARFEQAKAGNHDAIVRLKALIEANEKEIDKLIVANEKNKKIQRYCDYAQAIYDWFKDFYDRQEKEVKDDLLASINENFSKMYHGSREITMNNDYKITPVLAGDKSELAKSEGLETVTNFSFIMGLVELARKKAMKIEDEELANQPITEPYPIVMDAPFSNTDIKHIENITARLPEVAEQVIIFVMDKDWNYAKKELEKHLGSKYIIEKVDNQDNHSTLRREI